MSRISRRAVIAQGIAAVIFLTSQWKCLASSWQKMGGHGEQFHLMGCGNRDSSLPMLCLHDAGVLGARAPGCLDHSIQLSLFSRAMLLGHGSPSLGDPQTPAFSAGGLYMALSGFGESWWKTDQNYFIHSFKDILCVFWGHSSDWYR